MMSPLFVCLIAFLHVMRDSTESLSYTVVPDSFCRGVLAPRDSDMWSRLHAVMLCVQGAVHNVQYSNSAHARMCGPQRTENWRNGRRVWICANVFFSNPALTKNPSISRNFETSETVPNDE